MNRYVIIGNGVAGDSAAVKIRELDSAGPIDMFTREEHSFYYRPRLIDYLAGEVTLQRITLHRKEWYDEQHIGLHLSTEIASVDTVKKEVATSSGEVFPYDRLLFATGAECFVPPISGVPEQKERVFTLKHSGDADRILEKAKASKEALLIGGGLLGLETGNSLRKLGLSVHVVEFFPRLLPRQLDVKGAGILQSILASLGFVFYLGETSERLDGDGARLRLHLKSGKTVEGDFVIVSAGVRPDLTLARKAGLAVGKGITADDLMKTSVADIFAAGDAIEHRSRLYGIWPPAREQGEVAGSVMAGHQKAYEGTLPSHKLKVVGIDLVSMGEIDAEEKHESLVLFHEGKSYKKAVVSEGTVIGAIMLGDTAGETQVAKAIREKAPVDSVREFFR
ncbi:MAG: FAD-dependent oxidoreductase [Candidatus Eremiobacteraeota bacterium]|nr:FAD-dependent oxidoreductase [Candidatus Eremiobacteraeota bacterium]